MSIFTRINWPITLGIFLLLSIGILVIYSSSPELAFQQGMFSLAGLFIYFLIAGFDYRAIRNFITPLYIFGTVLLIVVFLIGVESRGSLRWISLGAFNIQPSELIKPILVLTLAKFWMGKVASWKNIFKSFLWTALPIFLVFKQPDLGTSFTLLVGWIALLFAAKISIKKVVLLLLIAALVVPVTWFTLHDYQRQRIVSFFSPQSDPLGVGYNLVQSTIAVGSGQFLGRGLGHGTQSRLRFLPEFRTDFIFASIAEELGFVGSIFILGVYLFLISYCLRIAQQARDNFGYLIVFGVVATVFFQAVVNIGMNMGLLPITGITLPLISYGGSSLIATMASFGLVSSVARYRKRIDI